MTTYEWWNVGTTGRAHLFLRLSYQISECGMKGMTWHPCAKCDGALCEKCCAEPVEAHRCEEECCSPK